MFKEKLKTDKSQYIIFLLLLSFFMFSELTLYGQSLEIDTLKEVDIFVMEDMKMINVNSVGSEAENLDRGKFLDKYFDFSTGVNCTEDLIKRGFGFYQRFSFDKEVEVLEKEENRFRETNISLVELFQRLNKNKSFFLKGKNALEKITLILRQDYVSVSPIFRIKKSIMLGNPVFLEIVNADNPSSSTSNDFATSTEDEGNRLNDRETLLIVGYDNVRSGFLAITKNGATQYIYYEAFMQNDKNAYVMVPVVK